MAEIVVTGGTGLLGSRVLESLAQSHNVTVIARRRSEQRGRVQWLYHDLRLPTLPPDLPSRTDVVIHLAQGRQFRDFPAAARDTFAVNVAATALLLDWAHTVGARQFVLASTGGVYPRSPAPHTEDEPIELPAVPSFYASSKLAAEALARAYGSHMIVTVLRPFFIYGRGQDANMLIPRLIRSIRSGQAILLDGPDGIRFNPVYVDDAAKAVVAALALEESGVVNIAGPETLTLRQAAELLATHLGAQVHFDIRPDAAPADLIGDISRMTSRLVTPRVRLADVAQPLCRDHADGSPEPVVRSRSSHAQAGVVR